MLKWMPFCSWARRRADIALALATFDLSLLISLSRIPFGLLHAVMDDGEGVGGIVGKRYPDIGREQSKQASH